MRDGDPILALPTFDFPPPKSNPQTRSESHFHFKQKEHFDLTKAALHLDVL